MMKRIWIVLALLTALCAFSYAEAEQEVYCEEMGFYTSIPDGTSAQFDGNNGLRISVGKPGYVPYVLVYRMDRTDIDPQEYIDGYSDKIAAQYGSRLRMSTEMEFFETGGKKLPAGQYVYDTDNARLCLLRLVEKREDHIVLYTAKYIYGDEQATLSALDLAVAGYRPEEEKQAKAGSVAPQAGRKEVHCQEQGFTVEIPQDLTAAWMEGDGLEISVENPGYVPYVLVWRRSLEKKLNNPKNYVNNVYREHMEDTYGDAYRGGNFFLNYEAGGKTLLGARYRYDVEGGTLCLLHLVEVRDDGDVEYFAKFLDGKGEQTLKVLDGVVGSYRPDGDTAEGTGAGELSTEPYTDGRFSVTRPKGWLVKTSGEHAEFAIRVCDPDDSERAFFLCMKVAPFLKSEEAREQYRKLMGISALYRMNAEAPVLPVLTVPAFLKAIPEMRAYLEKHQEDGAVLEAQILPAMEEVTVLSTEESTMDAPPDCTDNSVAHIRYTDAGGREYEGTVTAQVTKGTEYTVGGIDLGTSAVYLFMGVTAPAGELKEVEPVLTQCLNSFSFTDGYADQASGT